MICLLLLWMIGTYSLYVRTCITLNKRGTDEVAGEYKAVIELAEATQMQLKYESGVEETSDTSVITEKQLRRRITKDLNGGSISYKSALLNDTASDGVNDIATDKRISLSFRAWIKNEIWWLATVAVCFVAVPCVVIVRNSLLIIILLPLELPLVMYVGSSNDCRGILLFYLFWFWSLRAIAVALLLQMGAQTSASY
ncbi:hypothetical protein CC86DRAFT_126637 [Ophiobolus disseminans]|uniref:Uncharacterized protein n=1 Tax=Ophiobolus disseminans TaxID=1469910 RepID=A0A6A6ZFA1_9PLEO|nr:hypothetical protein CC86DRAFT_126637 [Ophiobolus disseminans]